MTRIVLEVKDDLLDEAMTALGTATKNDTVNAALRFAVEESRSRRERALRELQAVADEGGFDFNQLRELDR
ncbi:type II toxin-antitoxin system VapB family antitoxin [Catellatospora citrea]|uniref:VapB protein of antitoxin of type II toxin-antitoxin system n=1 Tax=Catellatospora citrea TaxID=53366 RepID=A0A8J3KPR9_9ACTN|nr:type II toxin-antitoxin system VapB family antitoxin [Catellatospora citrea]RKE06425.1 VapB protein of antitoxin of type II toxin-antitoxin system [Catellatospora citrea]GIG02594.1 hypothetical protein Cci01nite_76870 [Catellatospora citrea]